MSKLVKSLLAIVAAGMLCGTAQAGPILATDGEQFLYLTTGPGSTGAGASGTDRTGDFGQERDIATWTQTYSGMSGSESLAFDINILTSEVTGEIPDVIEIRLNGESVFRGVIAIENGAYPVIPAGSFSGEDFIGFDGSEFIDGQTGWFTISELSLIEGDNTIEFFVGDDSDNIFDTALLVDNLQIAFIEAAGPGSILESFEGYEPFVAPPVGTSVGNVFVVNGINPATAPVPEPTSAAILGIGLCTALGLGGRRKRAKKTA